MSECTCALTCKSFGKYSKCRHCLNERISEQDVTIRDFATSEHEYNEGIKELQAKVNELKKDIGETATVAYLSAAADFKKRIAELEAERTTEYNKRITLENRLKQSEDEIIKRGENFNRFTEKYEELSVKYLELIEIIQQNDILLYRKIFNKIED